MKFAGKSAEQDFPLIFSKSTLIMYVVDDIFTLGKKNI